MGLLSLPTYSFFLFLKTQGKSKIHWNFCSYFIIWSQLVQNEEKPLKIVFKLCSYLNVFIIKFLSLAKHTKSYGINNCIVHNCRKICTDAERKSVLVQSKLHSNQVFFINNMPVRWIHVADAVCDLVLHSIQHSP